MDRLAFPGIPQYVTLLFRKFLEEIKVLHQKGTLWLNHYELNKKQYLKVKDALLGEGKLFDLWGINKAGIPCVQHYQWLLEGDEYQELKDLDVLVHVKSPSFVYSVHSEFKIPFHLRCYAKYTKYSPQCAIFVEIEEFPKNVKKLRIAADIKGTLYKGGKADGKKMKSKEHIQSLNTQILTPEKKICGFQLFDYQQLTSIDIESLEWMIGVKILRAEHFEYDEAEEHLRDLYHLLS